MAVKIGPRIEVEGESQYRDQMRKIIQETKTLASEMKALTSSFDDERKSLKQNSDQRKLLNEQIKKQEEALKSQTEMLEKSTSKYGEADTNTLKYRQNVADTTAELNRLKAELDKLPNSIELVGTKMREFGESVTGIGDKVAGIGKNLTTTVTTPILGAFTAGVKAAVDWESAFTGVMKTVDETTTTTYDDIASGIKEIAKTTASSKEEIAGVAEVAGQLGISADDIVDFTRTMVQLGDTTNLSAEEVATSMARIMNITGDSTKNVDKLGSVIVDLGNNFATSESEIVAMANRLAASGKLAGLTTPEIMALSAAMTSVGIQAEAGGTAMTQTLTNIESSVANFRAGTESSLGDIAEIAGMSAEDFAKAWEERPIEAVSAFIEGLGGLDEKGESATLILDELGMSGIRQSNMLKSLALASDTLTGAIDVANGAYAENNALTNEANKRYETMSAKFNQLKERLSEAAITIGETLMPYVESGVEKIGAMADKFSSLDEGTRSAIVTFAGIAAAIGPILLIGGKLISGIGSIITAGGTIVTFVGGTLVPAITAVGTVITGTVIPAVMSMASAFATAIIPILPIVAAIAAVIAIGVLLYQHWDEVKAWAFQLWENIKQVWDGIKTTISSAWENIKTTTSNIWNNIKTSLSGIVNGINTSINSALTSAESTVTSIFESIKSAIQSKMEGAKSVVSNMINAIKGLFNFSWSLPKLKLPHISISGSFSLMPPSVPHFHIDWYKKAMGNGMILNGATIFGQKNGKLLGGGEAGPEVVVGASSLYGMIQNAVGNAGGGDTDVVINVYGAQGQDVNELARQIERRLTAMYENRKMVFGQ